MKAGKSTVGRMVADAVGRPFYSLDRLERRYTEPAGFNPTHAKSLQQREGNEAWYQYRRQFFAVAVVAFLAEHPAGILELGGGHPIVADQVQRQQIKEALSMCGRVILLIPSHDRVESLRLLNSRPRPQGQFHNWNRHFLKDDRYWQLATDVVLTAGKLPRETVGDVLAILGF